ncbi:TIGR02444 family protein [Halomonas sp. Bachu 37]|uniref:TIGR02444 family protein n=1 Tax=Halomonas kashgarensis TaxID=3084920 RepID=UPI003217D640
MLDSTRLAYLKQRPLWDFALGFYASPGVETACLRLQEEQEVDVCELLFHCWLFGHGLAARQEALSAIRESQNAWQRDVTQMVRTLRRQLKELAQRDADVGRLRSTLKDAELQAERVTLQRWQAWVWESKEPASRLMDIAVTQQNASYWLQNQLFSPQLPGSVGHQRTLDRTANSAWDALVRQLDPLKLPR